MDSPYVGRRGQEFRGESDWHSDRREDGCHSPRASPCSHECAPPSSCVLLLTDLPSPPDFFSSAPNNICFSWYHYFWSSDIVHPTLSAPPRGSLPFPFTHSTFVFLNMFWPTFEFCFSNLVPWFCWMLQPYWSPIADPSSMLQPYHTGHSSL